MYIYICIKLAWKTSGCQPFSHFICHFVDSIIGEPKVLMQRKPHLGFFLDGLARGSIIPFCWALTKVFTKNKSHPEESTTWQVRPWDDCLGMGNLLSVAGVHCWLLHEPQRKDRITWLVNAHQQHPRPTKKPLRATRPVTESRRQRDQGFRFFWDEIFGAFGFEFFARQVSPAKSKKGAALIVQTLETITWPMKKNPVGYRVFKEPETTQLYGDYFINHAIECFKGLITEMAGFFSTTQGFSCFNRQLEGNGRFWDFKWGR